MHERKYPHIYKILDVSNYCSNKREFCSDTVFMIAWTT